MITFAKLTFVLIQTLILVSLKAVAWKVAKTIPCAERDWASAIQSALTLATMSVRMEPSCKDQVSTILWDLIYICFVFINQIFGDVFVITDLINRNQQHMWRYSMSKRKTLLCSHCQFYLLRRSHRSMC
jgi:hypothetical protein